MAQEDLQKEGSAVESEANPEIASVEKDKNSQELATEMLGKIEQDFNSIPDSDKEINNIENSVVLEDQSVKDNIKSEIGLEDKLGTLDSEALNVKDDARKELTKYQFIQKISEFVKDTATIAAVSMIGILPNQLKGNEVSNTDHEVKIENNNMTEQSRVFTEREKFKEEAKKYKEYGMFMACNIASEKPTPYQEEQIKAFEDRILTDVEGRKFNSIAEMAAYINKSIDSDFSTARSSIYIKDAFPENTGEKPKGFFDCDARSVICLSVLDKLGISGEQVDLCLLEGHALLDIKKENTFLEMTNNQTRQLDKDELLQVDKINSFDKYYAYLLSNEGTALASEAEGDLLHGKNNDKTKMLLALDKMNDAAELDPYNLSNNLNLLRTLETSHDRSFVSQRSTQVVENIKRGLLNNYYNIDPRGSTNKTLTLKPHEIANQEADPRHLEDLGSVEDLTVDALGKSDYLSKKFDDLGFDLFEKFNNPKEAASIFELLAKSQESDTDKETSPDYCGYQSMVARCYFSSGQYEKYLSLAENKLFDIMNKNSKDEIHALFEGVPSKISAIRVITGKIKINESTVDDFCKEYKDDQLLGAFISGKQDWNPSAQEAANSLKDWQGFNDMMKILDNWREKRQ